MTIIQLYKYKEGGATVVSPRDPGVAYEPMYRLIAEEGKELTDGTTVTTCIDVESTDGWREYDPNASDDYATAGKILLGEEE